MTGRRMNGSERFMISPAAARPPLAGQRRLLDAHLAARHHAELPVEDHALAGLEALFDDNQIALPLAELHGPQLGGRVFLTT